jgi:hypothetical protein
MYAVGDVIKDCILGWVKGFWGPILTLIYE